MSLWWSTCRRHSQRLTIRGGERKRTCSKSAKINGHPLVKFNGVSVVGKMTLLWSTWRRHSRTPNNTRWSTWRRYSHAANNMWWSKWRRHSNTPNHSRWSTKDQFACSSRTVLNLNLRLNLIITMYVLQFVLRAKSNSYVPK